MEPAVLQGKIEEYKAQLAEDSKSTSFVALSDAYLAAGQVDDALETALKGTWELPAYADGFAAVGRVYAHRKVTKKAEEAFYNALSKDQMCIAAYKGLAGVLKGQGEIQKASDILTKAIMLDPGDASLQQMIEALSSAPGVSEAVVQSEPASVQSQEPAMEQPTDGMKPITTATIADIYIEQGLYDKALEVYHELLTENPQDTAVQQKISELKSLMAGAAPQAGTPPAADAVGNPAADEGVSPAPEGVGSESVIMKLNDWLAAIQSRRHRV